MSATTVKLEERLLREIRAVKPREQSLAAYVREAVERDLLRRKLKSAAEEYQTFLNTNADEQDELETWERASLVVAPRRRHR
jgi:hypothetical protein